MNKKGVTLTILLLSLAAGFGIINFGCGSQRGQDTFSLTNISDMKAVHPIVIIGSGCAGWSAAIYGARSGIPTLVITGSDPGGQLNGTTDVENFPGFGKELGPAIMDRLQQQAVKFGAEVLNDTVTNISCDQWPFTITTQGGKTIQALSIIVATGASPRTLKIPGEQDYWGKGVTTCAICDAAFHKGNDVLVVGGGDSAIEHALQLAPYAKTITVAVRGDRMRASAAMQKRLAGIKQATVLYNTRVIAITGDGRRVTGVELRNDKTDETVRKQVTGVFLAIGHDPNTALFKKIVELDPQGYIIISGRGQKTSRNGVFAAGDVEDHVYRQAGVASGSGIKAALDAIKFLQEEVGLTISQFADPLVTVPEAPAFSITSISDIQEFQSHLKGEKAVVVDFYTKHCPSCKQLEGMITAYAPSVADKATFVRIDAGDLRDIAEEYHIVTVPTLLIFKNGSIVARYNSAIKSAQTLSEFVQQALV
jgi:thioredoxin reductase (NADPH)